MQVRNSGGGGGKREGKWFMLPDVMGGVGGDGGEDLEVERMEERGDIRIRRFGIGEGEFREYGVENGVFWKSGALLGEDGGEEVCFHGFSELPLPLLS